MKGGKNIKKKNEKSKKNTRVENKKIEEKKDTTCYNDTIIIDDEYLPSNNLTTDIEGATPITTTIPTPAISATGVVAATTPKDDINEKGDSQIIHLDSSSSIHSSFTNDNPSRQFEYMLKNAEIIELPVVDNTATQGSSIDNKHLTAVLYYFHNFLQEQQLLQTLEVFEREYVEKFDEDIGNLRAAEYTDIFAQNELLRNDVQHKEEFTKEANISLEKATKRIEKLIKERDYHSMHHRRVEQEKETLNKELQKRNKEIEKLKKSLEEAKIKYEAIQKEKMMVVLEKDKRETKIEGLLQYIERLKSLLNGDTKKDSTKGNGYDETNEQNQSLTKHSLKSNKMNLKERVKKDTPWPVSSPELIDTYQREYFNKDFITFPIMEIKDTTHFKAHDTAISGLAYSEKLQLLATGGDDGIWKSWTTTTCELIMASLCHKNWVGDICFHKDGNILCTSGGDSKIKMWDLLEEKCIHTFNNNTGPVWSLSFHHNGDFLAAGSMDQTVRIFDMNSLRQRQILRGHVDSVNCVNFHHCANTIATAAADKTVSLWDMRSGLCENTFYGHNFPCNYVTYNCIANKLYSCDSGGIVKIWDIRSNKCFLSIDVGPESANKCPSDENDEYLFVASNDNTIKVFDLGGKTFKRSLKHEAAVKNVIVQNCSVYCSLANGEVHIWSL